MFVKFLRLMMVVAVTTFGATQAHAANAASAASAADKVDISFLTEGKDDAPLTITEFSSYTCVHCAHFHEDNRKWLIDTYVKTGRAKLVLHDYPLDGLSIGASMLVHSLPQETAKAFSETLFAQQTTWRDAQNPRTALETLAGLAGLSKDKVDAIFADQALFQALNEKRKYAYEVLKVDSTPTLIIGGKKIAANSSRDELTQVIEAAEKAATAQK